MKTIRSKSHRPLKVHLSGDKVLHLGPGKEGQISTHDIERLGIQQLIASGDVEIVGEGQAPGPAHENRPRPRGHPRPPPRPDGPQARRALGGWTAWGRDLLEGAAAQNLARFHHHGASGEDPRHLQIGVDQEQVGVVARDHPALARQA